jgi:hypothetical protein
MKTIRHNLALLLVLMLPCLALAGNGDEQGKYTKEKKIAKAYIVNPDCGLLVNSQFGNVYVTTWDENKTQIEVVIKVSGNNEDKVNRKLAGINIDLSATVALVKASTSIDNNSGGSNLNMEINYTIKIPKKGSITLNNQYGSIITGKIYGKAMIDCQYGDINLDELNADNNSISMQYCGSGKVNFIKNGDIHIQYSSLNLTKVVNLQINSQYSEMRVGDSNNVTYKTEYGELTIRSANNVTGAGDYSDLTFGYVGGNFNANSNYGDIRVNSMGKDAKNIAINATYSDVMVNYNQNAPFDFEFILDYGDLRGGAGLKYTEKSERDTSARYKGYNKSPGVNRMYIKSEYGDIHLGKN